MRARPGERFSAEIALMPAMVGAYARAAGADNPVHHDVVLAASTRYGRRARAALTLGGGGGWLWGGER
jgi:acyl dehydratase